MREFFLPMGSLLFIQSKAQPRKWFLWVFVPQLSQLRKFLTLSINQPNLDSQTAPPRDSLLGRLQIVSRQHLKLSLLHSSSPACCSPAKMVL